MFKLEEVRPKIFCAVFDDPYTLAMTFMRYQEFYESQDFRFKNQAFTWFDFMDAYTKGMGDGAFTYASDWGGFNIPSTVITRLLKLGIPDLNRYDHTILAIHSMVRARQTNPMEDYYLIGIPDTEDRNYFLRHELAHGLFFTNEAYNKEMTKLVNGLSVAKRTAIFAALKETGYCEDVYVDEAQAYMATGLYESMENLGLEASMPKFAKVFDKYYRTDPINN